MLTSRRFHLSSAIFAVLFFASAHFAQAFDGPKASPEKEKELLAVLRSDAPSAQKAITCKLLAIHGSGEAAADLAKLLPDPQLHSWARIALEAIPGPEADEVLRKAAETLTGNLLVGTINSIGIRRDAKAVDLLRTRLSDPAEDVASAAAVALGKIGNDIATKQLRESLNFGSTKVPSAVAEGCVLCAERALLEGKAADAIAIYDDVRKAHVPKQRILEATRGAILARGKDGGVDLLIEQLRHPERDFFRIGLSTAREFPGADVDKSLADELARATPERAALLIQAMADRKATVVLSAIVKAAEKGPKSVQLSAVSALARVGDATCLATLLGLAVHEDSELAQAARSAIAELPGNVNAEIVAMLPKASANQFPVLIELVGQRRIEGAEESLLAALDHASAAVRSAAIAALGETVAQKNLAILINQVVTPKRAEDAEPAQKALRAASVRMPDREACAAALSAALDKAKGATKGVIMEILGEVGGTKALETIGLAAKGENALLLDTSSRLLGSWMTADAAPVLLDLAKSAPGEKYQTRAMRAYIRIARQFVLPEQERADMCKKALATAKNPAEQKLVMDILERYPHIEMLKLAVKATETPAIKEDATQAVIVIAQKLGSSVPEVAELMAKAGVSKVKVEIVKAEYGAGTNQKDVTELLRKQIGDLPILTLPGKNYATSFGGDPAPGTVKQLKIQYKLNDKAAEASFAENALIILPTPK